MDKIAVLGAGSWGTTIAVLLGEKGYSVMLWARREEVVAQIKSGENKEYLPGIKIPKNVDSSTSISKCMEGASMIFSVIPSEFLRTTMKEVAKSYKGQIIVSATKGIEHSTGKRMSQVIEDEVRNAKVAALSGPNHAEEVSMKSPTASVVACKDKKIGLKVSNALNTQTFKTYYIDDIAGVELCGALKNITAIATGVCDGIGFGDNAKASIITLGLTEMNNLGKHLGAKRGTVYGLAGVGDLIATCMSKHSRNRFVGEQLARGKTIEEIRKEMKGMIAEGVPTTRAIYEYCRAHKIELPLTQQAYEVLFKGKNINTAIADLLKLV